MGMTMDLQPADLSAAIGKVMGEVLLRPPLAADEDFFDAGGDSLRAIEVLQRLAKQPDTIDHLGSTDMQATLLEVIFEDGSPRALASAAAAHA